MNSLASPVAPTIILLIAASLLLSKTQDTSLVQLGKYPHKEMGKNQLETPEASQYLMEKRNTPIKFFTISQ